MPEILTVTFDNAELIAIKDDLIADIEKYKANWDMCQELATEAARRRIEALELQVEALCAEFDRALDEMAGTYDVTRYEAVVRAAYNGRLIE